MFLDPMLNLGLITPEEAKRLIVEDMATGEMVRLGLTGVHEAGTSLQAPPCCTVELSSATELVATHEASAPEIEEASVALVGPTDGIVIASRNVCELGLFRERAPPNIHGPPIFIRNCSFLN